MYKVNRVNTLGVPLKIHEDIAAFKLFILDCGLLGAMSQTPPAMLLLPSRDNTGKGDFTENFVCSQMKSISGLPVFYYSKDNSQLELDFVIQAGVGVYPVEVKAEENLQSKSLKTTLSANPQMRGLRFSMSDYRDEERLVNVPLYGVREFVVKLM